MAKEQKKKVFQLQLNEIKKTDDPTKLPCTFIIFDFETSHNNTVISKEVALDASPTIINKPIVAKYHEVEGINTATDALGSHEAYLGTDKHGELEVKTDTTPIGVFTSEGYIIEIDTAEGKKEVLAADAVLWSSRFSDACELLLEWYSRGININTSCEILYSNYSVKDGIEYIEAPIYLEGHAILNSEKRGEHDIVLPAYDSSRLVSFNEMQKFEKLVAQAANQEKQKEGEKVDKFKKVFELSHSDIRALIYNQLDPTLESNEESYIADVYDTYFIVNIYSWSEDNSYDKYYKINYAKNGDTLTIDFDSKIEVFLKRNWEEVVPEEIQSQLNEKDTTISKLSEQFNEIKEKFNTASEKLVQLNSALEELKPFKEQHEKAEFEKRVQEKKEFYKSKFEALNAEEKFETEEVQNLILASAKDSEETDKAILQLNSMLVDLVDHEADQDEVFIRELSSKREKLLKEDDSFESRYSS
ncbi:hypothetical protein SFC27_10970 [Bacillus licheniformis]|uniref:Uncharacterized protein n=2 Tax=Bacillus subtilis group TaxID=653685 RepID=A0A8B5YA90_BACLI|nr:MULTISPECIES: hypothetical protein [Bacillus subtilis group]ARC58726.1 hypothetical protein BaDB11_00056 [Bacillus licheniformis]EQM25300.1 hypothetical protein N399_23895 [Bacillus licheniformis CG-B52]KND06219.1 hypothetical protein ACJ43_17770 [Bacillus paralicheniformis]MCY9239083.1 hypothetical protein [Bacillus licheniformis]MDE1362833.1 hypothetical protein [Bacillus paralicheniformis]